MDNPQNRLRISRVLHAGYLFESQQHGEPTRILFDPIFSDFGPLQISTNLQTCCADGGFSNRFDRLLANSPARPASEILTHITDSKEITYPLDPGFSKRPNEEHKAIFGVVEFVPRARKR